MLGVSSWAVCVANDWLVENHALVETEGSISRRTKQQLVAFGGGILSSTTIGNFDAELTAIVNAVVCVPISCSITIVTDSKSSIDSINSWSACTNHRRRLRMAGRPLLAFIHQLIGIKQCHSGVVQLLWVPAHTNGADLDSVGNRIADDYAGVVSDPKANVIRRCDKPIDLQQHENFVAIRLVHEGNRVLTTDPRRAAAVEMMKECTGAWSNSRTQSLFHKCCDEMKALWLCVMKNKPVWSNLVMQMVSDNVQWCYVGNEVVEVRCEGCGDVRNITHMVRCPYYEDVRKVAVDGIVRICNGVWGHRLDVIRLMNKLRLKLVEWVVLAL